MDQSCAAYLQSYWDLYWFFGRKRPVTYLVITIGIVYHTGIISLLNYFTREKVEGEPSPMFPIDGNGQYPVRSMVSDHAAVFR